MGGKQNMQNMRRQQLDPDAPFEFFIAADARSSRTDYSDDQAWQVRLGARQEAALSFPTQFGGRADLVSLNLSLRLGDRVLYQQWSYAQRPVITHFAPNYLQVEAAPTDDLQLVARYWAMESRAAGGEFELSNRGESDLQIQVDLLGGVIMQGRKRKLNVLTLADGMLALHLGEIGDINPVATLEGAAAEVYGRRIGSAKLGTILALPAGASARIPFVCAGLADMRDSFSLALNWLSRPWQRHFQQIDKQAAAVPRIHTGNAAWDRVIDLSYAQLLKAFLQPTAALPEPSFVANRAGNRGWSSRGSGRDHLRAWSGQDPLLAYLAAPAIATVDARLAKAILRNYVSVQDDSGFIDRQPGLAGQRQGLLMMPLLARMTWQVVQLLDDRDFAAELYPALRRFFKCWLSADWDADGDGVPEWRSERQMGYIAFPSFGGGQGLAQGADIRHFETPDLLAYLVSEADALCCLAELLDDSDAHAEHSQQLAKLEAALDELWIGDRYGYRDRDSHLHSESVQLLRGGAGDQQHHIDRPLPQPARVLVRVVGGVSQRPRMRLTLRGLDRQGAPCEIRAEADAFDWRNRQGFFTTPALLTAVHSLDIDGLSRVYKVYASTIDTSRLDINALLPLWTGRLHHARARALVKLALDETHFLRANGITMVSASDRSYDPSNAKGGGGIWMFWQALVGEGMAASGFRAETTALLQRILTHLSLVLEREGKLSQFYHAEAIQGFGEAHHIGGIAPLKLLADVLGLQIVGHDRVWVGGAFSWGSEITVQQHGVTVTRSDAAIDITFPSGHSVSLAADAPWQLVQDTTAASSETDENAAPPAPPLPGDPPADAVQIHVDGADDAEETDDAHDDGDED